MANNFVISGTFTSGNNFTFASSTGSNNVTVYPGNITLQGMAFQVSAKDYSIVSPGTLSLIGSSFLVSNITTKVGAVTTASRHVRDYQHITPLVDPEDTKRLVDILVPGLYPKSNYNTSGFTSNLVAPVTFSIPNPKATISFTDLFYYRIHIIPSRIDFGIITNNNSTPITIWNSTTSAVTLGDFTSSNLTGSGVTVDNLSTTIGSGGLLDTNVNVTVEGTPQIAGMLSLTTGGFTTSLSIIGLRAIIFPFRVDKHFSETYSWVTDISPARHGETRLSLTDVPMLELSYNYIFEDKQEEQFARNLSALLTTTYIGLPIWSQSFKGVNTLVGHTSFNLSNTNLKLAVGNDVIIWTNYYTYEVVRVLEVTSSIVYTENPIALTQSNAYIARFIVGFNNNSITFKRRAGGITQADIKVSCDVFVDNYSYTPTNTFNTIPIIEEILDNTSEDSTDYGTDVEIYNNSGIGVRQLLPLDDYNRAGQTLSLVSLNNKFNDRYRSLFFYLKGRTTVFYLPFGYGTIEPLSNIVSGNNTITIRYIGVSRLIENKAIKIVGNVTDYFTIISSATASNRTEVLTLSPTPSRNITNITSVQLMLKTRLASDSVTFNYKPNIMQVAARTLEVLV